MDNLQGTSQNIQADELAKLAELFPSAVQEGGVNFAALQALLGESVDLGERYGISWKGKANVFRAIQESTTKTLKPSRDESIDFDTTENLFIEGDNLEALKVLQRSYYGKVKMIYIDPPYNTGNDFVYNDAFAQNKGEYEKEAGIRDDQGNIKEVSGLRPNSKDGGHYHSNWLNMMYPRLYLARNMLSQEGVIFLSIDDNEVHNLRMIMNEIFGEENFLASIVWKRRQIVDSRSKSGFSSDHEYLLCYSRQPDASVRGADKDMTKYSNPDNHPNGPWMSADMTGLATKDQRPNLHYDITDPATKLVYACPPTGWRYEPKRMQQFIDKGEVIFPVNPSGRPRRKKFLEDLESEYTGLSTIINGIFNTQATRELRELFDGKEYFDFPKPVELLELLIEQGTSREGGDIVLDFFAGSGTTGHAVMALNAKDGGNRRWVCVQLPEEVEMNSEAFQSGFKTIADIAKERIRRVSAKMRESISNSVGQMNGLKEVYGYSDGEAKESQAGNDQPIYEVDLGFKVLKLDQTNFNTWNTNVKSADQLRQQMLDIFDSVREGVGEEDLLTELMLKNGIELTAKRKQKDAGHGGYWIINDSLVVCLAQEMSAELFADLLSEKPKTLIILEGSLRGNDELKANLTLQAERESVQAFIV